MLSITAGVAMCGLKGAASRLSSSVALKPDATEIVVKNRGGLLPERRTPPRSFHHP
jgi:hypothetical protein